MWRDAVEYEELGGAGEDRGADDVGERVPRTRRETGGDELEGEPVAEDGINDRVGQPRVLGRERAFVDRERLQVRKLADVLSDHAKGAVACRAGGRGGLGW